MPQSQLPDLNTLWLKWMDSVSSCLRNNDYLGAIASIFHINAVFGSDNRVEFNTTKYNELTTASLRVMCKHCKVELARNEIEFVNLLLPFLESVITKEKYQNSWHCPKCHGINRVKTTEFIQDKFITPRYLGVVPEPPKPGFGLSDRREFERKARDWIRLTLDELSYALGLERREYVPINDRMDLADLDDND